MNQLKQMHYLSITLGLALSLIVLTAAPGSAAPRIQEQPSDIPLSQRIAFTVMAQAEQAVESALLPIDVEPTLQTSPDTDPLAEADILENESFAPFTTSTLEETYAALDALANRLERLELLFEEQVAATQTARDEEFGIDEAEEVDLEIAQGECGDLDGLLRSAQGDIERSLGRIGDEIADVDMGTRRFAIDALRANHARMEDAVNCLAQPHPSPLADLSEELFDTDALRAEEAILTGDTAILSTAQQPEDDELFAAEARPTDEEPLAESEGVDTSDDQQADADVLATLSVPELVDALESIAGERVTVSGEAFNMVPERTAFLLGDDALLTRHEIAVLTQQPLRRRLSNGVALHVTGTLYSFLPTEIAEEFSLDVDDRLTALLADRPVLIADSVRSQDVFEDELLTDVSAAEDIVDAEEDQLPAEELDTDAEPLAEDQALTADEALPEEEVDADELDTDETLPEEDLAADEALTADEALPEEEVDADAALPTDEELTDEPLPVRDVVRNAADLADSRVVVSGEVTGASDDSRIIALGDAALFSRNEIAVLSEQPLRQHVQTGDPLQVTGALHPFVRAEIEDVIGYELGDRIAAFLADEHVLIAESIRTEAGNELLAATRPDDEVSELEADDVADDAPVQDDLSIDEQFDEESILDVDYVMHNSDALLDTPVTVRGKVREFASDHVLLLAENEMIVDDEIGVLSARAFGNDLAEGDILDVRGTLSIDLDFGLVDLFSGHPVLIADSVRTVE